ncbi:MAG TPA: HAMP domain-containing sensor histidine kinase [Gaiellaceae bacterium]
MSPFRSVAGQLALALLVVVAGVLGIVYLIVVPQYETSLRNNELSTLASELRAEIGTYPSDPFSPQVEQWATSMAEQNNVRAIVFSYAAVPPTVTPYADSNQTTDDSDLVDDRVALAAMRSGALVRGVVEHDGKDTAEVAVPLLAAGPVVMFAAPLDEQLETVDVVRRRVLVAGALATAFAVLLGYAGAAAFGRRIRRLEAAAERIAAGKFDEPVDDASGDELGQLARTFERMRLRLATLDQARGDFIANASHELRTPLFSLGGFLELLDDPELDEETRREFLGQMREQMDRLTKLATDLLDLSRLDAGRLGISSEPIDLSELAAELAVEFGPRASASGHPLELAAARPVAARGDTERALQIGRVLLENALVHTPAGTTIRLDVARDGGRATLSVADDGPGIPVELRARVFQRFARLDGSRASGSGLGLAIARELAEVMGGRIELDAAAGWTRFTLVLASDADVPDAVST